MKKKTDSLSSRSNPAPFMSDYFIFPIGILIIGFGGWLVYQLWYKNLHYKELKNDALAVAFFAGVWGFIVYMFY
jgi:hypothetical protein